MKLHLSRNLIYFCCFLLLSGVVFADENVKEKVTYPILPLSESVRAGNFVFISGQTGEDPVTSNLVTISFEAQVKQAFVNLEQAAKRKGIKLSNAVKLTLFVTDMSQFSKVNEVMKSFFSEPFPARSTIGVSALPFDASFEVEGIFLMN